MMFISLFAQYQSLSIPTDHPSILARIESKKLATEMSDHGVYSKQQEIVKGIRASAKVDPLKAGGDGDVHAQAEEGEDLCITNGILQYRVSVFDILCTLW